MNLVTLLIILLVIALFVGGPYTGWHGYGWGPSGIVGIILVVLVVLLLLGRL